MYFADLKKTERNDMKIEENHGAEIVTVIWL